MVPLHDTGMASTRVSTISIDTLPCKKLDAPVSFPRRLELIGFLFAEAP
jgi:hypothetical protein